MFHKDNIYSIYASNEGYLKWKRKKYFRILIIAAEVQNTSSGELSRKNASEGLDFNLFEPCQILLSCFSWRSQCLQAALSLSAPAADTGLHSQVPL